MSPRQKQNKIGDNGLAKYVAEKAGVSLMTVSRVFNGSTRVSEKTRKRILAVAKEVGYQPNIAARALRSGQSHLVGFMISSPAELCGPYHADTLAALEEKLSARGLTLAIMSPKEDEGIVGLIRRLVASRACGALVVRLDQFPEEELSELVGLKAPIVFGSSAPSEFISKYPFSSVGYDNKSGMAHVVRHLHSMGHRRIAYLGGTPGWFDSTEREAGFRDTMKELSLKVTDSHIKACDFAHGHDTALEAINEIFSASAHLPTAVACASDDMAAGVMTAAHRWAKSVPDDLSVVGFDDNMWCNFVSPPLTTVQHTGYELGSKLGDEILAYLDDPKRKPVNQVLPTKLVVRESTAPAQKEIKKKPA